MAFCARCKRLFRAHGKRHVAVLVVRLRRCPNATSGWLENQINGFGGEAAFNEIRLSRSAYGERRLQEVTGDGVLGVAASSCWTALSHFQFSHAGSPRERRAEAPAALSSCIYFNFDRHNSGCFFLSTFQKMVTFKIVSIANHFALNKGSILILY